MILGEHAPYANDVWQCLDSAAVSLSIPLRPIFAGAFYHCEGLRSGCASDATKDWLHSWMVSWDQEGSEITASGARMPGSICDEADGLMQSLLVHPDAQAAQPDFIVCGDSAIFCWLLRRRSKLAFAAGFHFTPALHTLGMGFFQYVPASWRLEMMQDFRSWWIEEMVEEREELAVFMELTGLQLQWQMGIALPFVPTLGSAALAGNLYRPPVQGEPRSVLVLKSGFWKRPIGRVFETLMRRLVKEAGPQVVFSGWSAGQPYFHSFSKMASHTAILYVPDDFSQIRFRDMYNIGVPLLAPDEEYHRQLLLHMFSSWGQLHAEHDAGRLQPPVGTFGVSATKRAERVHMVMAEADRWQHAPFYEPKLHPRSSLPFWLPLADVHRYPHVSKFSSLTGLLMLVEGTDWEDKSLQMQRHTQLVTKTSSRM
ncbi:unnamed protein product [Polarella glacialis]|nr:unnamed protein product [Polarella glacialis]